MVSYEDVEAAAGRLAGIAHRTPVATSRTLDERLAARLFLKCENLQRAGAFKFRGAYNAVSRLTRGGARARACSRTRPATTPRRRRSPCRLLGARATIVMPQNAPAAKRRATEGYGARIVAYDPAAREARGGRRAAAPRGRPGADPALRPRRRDRGPGHRGARADRGGGRARPAARSLRRRRAALRARRSRRGRSRRRAAWWASSPSWPTTPRAPSRRACCRP